MDFTFPFPTPFTSSDSTKKIELRARAYQSMVKFYGKVGQEVMKQSGDVDRAKIETALSDFGSDLTKVYDKFKAGESYDELNAFEKFNEDMGKMFHRSMGQFTKSIPNNENCEGVKRGNELADIGNELEVLWDEFFQLNGGTDGPKLTLLLNDFNEEVMQILQLNETGAGS